MDLLDILSKEWPLIAGAPVLAIGALAIASVGVSMFTWWLRGFVDDGELRGYKALLTLAKEREAFAKEKQCELEQQISGLKKKIEESASAEELEQLTAKVDDALKQFENANNAVWTILHNVPGSHDP